MKKRSLFIVGLAAICALTSCSHNKPQWHAEHITTLSGFNVPECTLYAPRSGLTYVSNIESKPDEYWTDDAKGYISVLGEDHRVTAERWVNSEPASVLHAPKGMCLFGKHLYVADNTRLIRCSLSGETIDVVASDFNKANDLATDGKSIWVSDTAPNKIFCISIHGDRREIMAPPGINGITFFGDKMFGVSWALHEIYELDSTGKNPPIPFGLAEHFKNLDGIEVLDDGTFLVSDFTGNTVYTVGSDRATVRVLVEIPSPADLSINRKDGVLYIPQFLKNKVSVYQIEYRR